MTNGQTATFSGLLREYRLGAGLTQEQLAERAGVSVRAVSDLERGLYLVPHRDTVTRLAEALGLGDQEAALLEATVVRQRGPAPGPSARGSRDAELAPLGQELPTGTVTFLVAEIDDDERLWESHAPAMRLASPQYDACIRTAATGQAGLLLSQPMARGGRLAVFGLASDALAAALNLQRMLLEQTWPDQLAIRVRVSLHVGLADVRDDAYYGGALNRCVRMCALASGGQVVVSESLRNAITFLPPAVSFTDLGEYQLTDHSRSEHIYGVLAPGLPNDFEHRAPRLDSPLDQHQATVLHALLDGRLILFLGDAINLVGRQPGEVWEPGSGASPPAASELARHLANLFHYPTEAPRDLSRVAQYVSTVVGSGPLNEELHELLDTDFAPTPVHTFVAALPAALNRAAGGHLARYPLVVTTAYDHGLEQAFQRSGEPFDLVSYVAEGPDRGRFVHTPPDGRARTIDKPNKYLGISEQRTTIVRLHGALDRVDSTQSRFVITEDDFLDYLVGGDISNLVPVTIAARLRRSHFLFLGYSLRDWNMRVILRRLWGEQRLNYKSWAVHCGVPESVERSLWRDRGVDVVDVQLADYLAALWQRAQSAGVLHTNST